jgi:hypothetical protein
MKALTERKIIRWLHIVFSIPVIGYIYGPVSEIENAVFMVRILFFPSIIVSGFWLWKGYIVKKWFTKRKVQLQTKLTGDQATKNLRS